MEVLVRHVSSIIRSVLSLFSEYDATLCKPNAYCTDLDDYIADEIASFVKPKSRKRIRLWKKEGDATLIPRGFGLRLEKLGLRIQWFAPWLPAKLDSDIASILRDYQIEVVESALAQMRKIGSAVVEVATGGGKTWIACAMALMFNRLGIPVIYAAMAVDLVMQFVKVCSQFTKVCMWTSDEKQICSITATTASSLYKAVLKQDNDLYRLTRQSGLFIFDESQHIPAKMLVTIYKNMPHMFFLSMSATPYHSEGLDEVIYAVSGDIAPRRVLSSELIRRGYLVPVHIIQVETGIAMSHEPIKTRKQYTNIKRKVIYNEQRIEFLKNVLLILRKYNMVPVMIYAKEIQYINAIMKKINTIVKVSSEVAPDMRKYIYEITCEEQKLVEEGFDGIAITTTGREGLDIPCLKTLILPVGGRSPVEMIQVAGRLTRPWPGKRFGLLIDLVDDVPVYRKQAKARVKIWQREPEWRLHYARNLDELEKVLSMLTPSPF